ncbi:MAG TPA: hypothetical protein VJ464_15885 [Blastocatellia bacterium]|nr:hypothetical protein [Blastocatellia bacterium]
MPKKKDKKKPADKALVKQAARDLGVTYQKGMQMGDLVRAEADRVVRQSAASSGIDPEDGRWRRLGNSRRDLTPIEQDRLIDIANYLACQNPLGKRIREIRRDFVIGDGVTFDAEDKKIIQPILDDFIADPVTNFDEYQFDLVDYIGINGELLLPTFVNDVSGHVALGWIDPVEVEQVLADQRNRRIMRVVKMKPGAGAGAATFYDLSVRKYYTVANVDTDTASATYGLRVGDLLFFRINCAPDGTRGRSDFEAIADLCDAWDQATFNDLERVALLLNFIWDVELKSKTEPEIEKWLEGQAEPKPGAIRAHNENVTWQAVAPDLKFTETAVLSKSIRNNTLGSAGLAPFFYGDTENSNRASSENLDLPILRGLASRQRKMKAVFREIGDYQIDQFLMRRPALRRQFLNRKLSRKFAVNMPELSTRDLSRVGTVLAQVTGALDLAVGRKWVMRETAALVFGSIIAQFGVEYDAKKELAEADKQQQDESESDYTPTRISQLREAVA